LRLAGNNLDGQLSPRISNLKSLVFLSLASNNFTNITNTFQILRNCRNLTSLLIGSNFRGEAMPEDETIEGFENLQVLVISNGSLSGNIPLWLSKLNNLQMLVLHTNQLSGPIPVWIKSLKSLFHPDISDNNLTGEIPVTLMEMPMLTTENNAAHLDPRVFELPVYKSPSLQSWITSAIPRVLKLANNNFTGVIPQDIGQLISLVVLNLSSNSLLAEIPPQLCNLTNLQELDLSSNHLTGPIPSELNNLHFLSAFNISHNNLEGSIPDGGQLSTLSNSSFEGNPNLCGPILHRSCGSEETPLAFRKEHSRKATFGITFGVTFGVVLLLLVLLLAMFKGKSLITKSKAYNNRDVEKISHMSDSEQSLVIVPTSKGEENKLKFADIVKATNDFHHENIIGCGAYGLVYKATLPDGSKLAI
jgi:Leucine-rich repeat (LRR) protein